MVGRKVVVRLSWRYALLFCEWYVGVGGGHACMSAVSGGVVMLLSFMLGGVVGGARWCWDAVVRVW